MNDLGAEHLHTLTLRLMTLLAGEPRDQLAWSAEHGVSTEDLIEEVQLFCRVGQELAERGVVEPENLLHLEDIDRRLGEMAAADSSGPWSGFLVADPAWGEVRLAARKFLLGTVGEWRRPLPRPSGSRAGGS
ncbi:hypothetical protein ACFCV8_15050 [Streptomyces sp. NPDC056347]|uniref:hypothetical protein n=1 Tax=Streptomyces sp. NPDC056347 TaxID=3345790 RepID=UPI0035E1F936